MRNFVNSINVTGFVARNTIETREIDKGRSVVRFGLRIPTNMRDKTQDGVAWKKVYSTLFMDGYFNKEDLQGVISVLSLEKAAVTVEGYFRSENYMGKDNLPKEKVAVVFTKVYEQADNGVMNQ